MNFLFDYFNSLFFSSKFLLIFCPNLLTKELQRQPHTITCRRYNDQTSSLIPCSSCSGEVDDPNRRGRPAGERHPPLRLNHSTTGSFPPSHITIGAGRGLHGFFPPSFLRPRRSRRRSLRESIDRMRSFAPPYAASCLAFDLVVFTIGTPRCQRHAETREGVVGDWSSPLLLTRDRTSPPNRCIRASVFFLSVFVAFIHSSLYPIKTKETGQFKP